MKRTLGILESTLNTPAVDRRIKAATRKYFHTVRMHTFFEHGHWWVTVNDRTYDVVDAEGQGSMDGFGFEEV